MSVEQSAENTPEVTPEATPEVTPEVKAVDPIAELKAFFQKELDALKAAKEPVKTKEPVKVKADDAETRLKELEAELEAARQQSERHLQTAVMVQNGLRSTRFAGQILAEYDGTKPFSDFLEDCKKDKDLSILFTQSVGQPKAPPPGAPDGGTPSRLGNTKSAEAQLRDFAVTQWPNDKFRQDAYIKHRMAMEKK
jgi:hypothetical protein